jgi:uncharacterized membrane protein YiaA
MTLQQHMSQFDFFGLALLMSGVICSLIGLNNGEFSCAPSSCGSIYQLIRLKGSSAETIALLCVGCTLLVRAAINEILTTRSPIVPPRLFKVRLCRFGRVRPIR